jgi:hypothetical protein
MNLIPEVATDLIQGSSNQSVDVSDRINDPLRYVDQFRMHREQSVREVVLSAIAVCDGIDAVRAHPEQLSRFMAALADAKLISKAESTKTEIAKMTMISKIRKISLHKDVLLHPNVAGKICTGYAVLYELALLIDELPSDGSAADQLGKHLETLDGDLTKKWTQDLRDSIAPIQRRAKKAGNAAEDAKQTAPQNTDPIEDQDEQTNAEYDSGEIDNDDDSSGDEAVGDGDETVPESLDDVGVVIADVGEPITGALLIVGKNDETRVVHAAQEQEWQRVADQMAEDSVVFIFTPLQVLLNISPVIDKFEGFRCANVYLLTEPDYLEVTKCNVLVIFERGEGVSVEGVPSWGPDDTPIYIAEQFLQGVPGRRLQIFADGPVEGWDTLTFDDDYTPLLHRSLT